MQKHKKRELPDLSIYQFLVRDYAGKRGAVVIYSSTRAMAFSLVAANPEHKEIEYSGEEETANPIEWVTVKPVF
ncbi:MAG: hypothetical protein V4643_10760 [Bacteroidota bacterium]